VSVVKAYCINLDRRPDRREYIWAEFQRLGIDVERVSAVDGSQPEIAAKVATLPPGFRGVHLGTGAYACFQSHRLCWQKLLDSGDPCAMVLEDDVVLADGIVDCLTDGWMPAEADVAKLETRRMRIHVGRKRITVGQNRYLARLRSTNLGGACYVISAAAAVRLLQLTSGFSDAVDDVLFDAEHPIFAKLAVFQMIPAPAIQGRLIRRPGDVDTWLQSSIDIRPAHETASAPARETTVNRLKRRMKEEWRAVLGATRYTFVPFG
jgi:glycosyl transferase, family 25